MTLNYTEIILIGFGVGIFLYLAELAWVYGGLAGYHSILKPDYFTPVSLIIAARDEEKNLKTNLKLWLAQKHDSFEVIVVNDCSYDNTAFLLKEYQRKHSHLQVINLEETNLFKGGKKQAISIGIKGAQFDRVLFTDADCKPNSEDWLASMNAQFSNQKKIVLGVGVYEKTKGILNYLIRTDAIQVAIQYMGMAARGFPYMGVGRNLAYDKKLFFEIGGFKKHIDLKWGDDDLFINETARGKNTAICAIPNAQTVSLAKKSWMDWFIQKRRHISTSGRYRFSTKILLSLKPARLVIYYSMLIAGLFLPVLRSSFIASALIVYFAHAFIFIFLRNKIGKVQAFYLFPIIEIVLFVLNILIYLSVWINKPKNWN